ncbi:MAG: M15 family metallopeptidase [Actinobacteria bacterium]|nr:M15 family metallopeptidase [Actinomycetota bacterium]
MRRDDDDFLFGRDTRTTTPGRRRSDPAFGANGHGPPGRSGRRTARVRRRRLLALALVVALGGGAAAVSILGGRSPTGPATSEGSPGEGGETDGTDPVRAVLEESAVAWMPGGFPEDVAVRMSGVQGVSAVAPVLSGVAWLTGASDAGGERVGDPPDGMAFPIEVAAAEPAAYRPFLPEGRQGVVGRLADGGAAIGRTEARVRGLGRGGTLEFGDVEVPVAAVLPDELMGGHEVLVSDGTGRLLGLTLYRYALVRPGPGAGLGAIREEVLAMLPEGTFVEIRGWSEEVPYLRHGDGTSSMARLKDNFGEFAAVRDGGELQPDLAWVTENIVTETVPLLGEVTCHRDLLPQLVAALERLEASGAGAEAVGSGYGGCYVPRFINRDPTRALSYHAWGVAIDVNAAANPYGAEPDQDERLVEAMEAQGFSWGGRWDPPDAMHFEWASFPAG